MKIGILSRNPKLYSTSRLLEEAIASGHDCRVIDTLKCYMDISSAKPAVWYRGNQLEHLDAIIRASLGAGAQQGAGYGAPKQPLASPYEVLDVEETTSDAEVKKAYRRLMSQHHPDKLVSKGLPEEMIELAKQKTQEIRRAYEQVKEQRGMR